MASTAGTPGAETTANADSGRSRAFAAGRPPKQPLAERHPAETERVAAPARAPAAVRQGRAPERPSISYRAHRPPPAESGPADELMRLLVEQLSPLLGLDAARVAIGVTADSGEPRGAASAHRVAVSGDPHDPRMKAVVAHELAHVRQHDNRELQGDAGDTTAAEAEAAGIALAIAEGRDPWMPRARLPSGRTARDTDVQGVAPTTAAPETDPSTGKSTTPDLAGLERQLDDFVAVNHTADVRTIRDLLDHPWTQNTSGMVENALRVLSGFPFVIARALVRAIPWADRRKLAQLDDDHHSAYPEAAIAVLSALTAKELVLLADTEVVLNGTPYPGPAAALKNVQPERLSPVARRALLATLRRAGAKTLTKLTDGPRRDLFRSLLESPPDAATDEAELRTALAAEKQRSASTLTSDGILRDRLEKLLRDGGRENAKVALTALAPVCGIPWPISQPAPEPAVVPTKTPPSLQDLRTAIAAAKPTGAGTNAPPETMPALVGLVAALDAQGLVAKLVEGLDEEDRRDAAYGKVLRVVLAARSPLANTSRAIELLSYGIFDWAVRDWETRLAYLLVRSVPIAAQDSWRQLDNGKWYGRLIDNLPQDMWDTGEYTGVGSEYSTGGVNLGVPETMLLGYAKGFIELWNAHHDLMLAKWIVRNLLALDFGGDANPWIRGDPAKDLALRTAVIRRLDALQGLNPIIAKLPDDYLLGEKTRQELLDLNQLRDPIPLVRQALALMPGIFGFLTFTPHDAWIALQALRALSPAAQQQFAVQNPKVWSTFWSGLTDEMRRTLPSTLASGRDQRLPTKAALRERLSDERLWTEPNAGVLRALVDLAVAADDRFWVFELTRRLRVDLKLQEAPRLTAVIHDFGLYSEAEKRTVFVPRQIESSHVPSGIRSLGVIAKGLALLAYHLFASDAQISLFGKTMHVKGFDLGDVQWMMGGDIIDGVTLGSSKGGANHIDLDATFADGFIVNLDLPRLDVAGVNMVLPGKTYKTGPLTIEGFKASAGFSDRGYTRPGYITAKFNALSLRDFVIVDPTLPLSGAWAVADLGVKSLGFNATPDAATDPSVNIGRELPKGTIPIPVFGPLFQLLANLVSLQGAIPFDFTLLDYAMIPLGIPFPLSSAVAYPINKAIPTPTPASYAWGLLSDGVLRPPYSAAQRIKDSTAMLRAFNVQFDKLQVKGITIGTGQQIESLTLTDVNISVGQSLPAYLRAALATVHAARVKAMPDTPQAIELEQRERTLQKQLDAALGEDAADEKYLQTLEGKDRWNPGSLKKKEREDLVRLTKRLRSDVGLVVEVGSIALGPLSGTVQSPGVTLKGIHARAKVPNVGVLPYTPGYLDDKSLIDQFVEGGAKVPTIGELANTSEFHLEIDETSLASTDPEQPAVVLRAATIPDPAALKKELDALPLIPGNLPLRERLGKALAAVIALEDEKRKASSAPTDEARRAAEQQVRELTDRARRLLGTEVRGLKFGRITGDLDASGRIAVSLNDIEATGIAGRAFAIDKAAGTASVGLSAGDVDARLDQVGGLSPDTLVTKLKPSYGLDGLTVSGIHLAGGSIGRVALGKLRGTLETSEKGYRVPNLTVDHLEVGEVAMGRDGDGIVAEAVSIDDLRMSIEVTVGRPAGGDTTVTGAVIPTLSIASLTGRGIVMDSPQSDGSTTHVAASHGTIRDIRGTDIAFAPGSKGWELVRAKGSVGSFEDVGFELAMGALSSRTTVKGTLTTATKRTSPQPTITASYAKGDDGTNVSLSVRDLLALGTDVTTPDGSLTVRSVRVAADYESGPKGGRATASLSGLVIGPIRWKVGTAVLSGDGPLTAATVTVAAVQSAPVPAVGKKPAKPAAWTVTDVVITKLTGRGLNWTDKPLSIDLGRSDKAGTGEPPLTVGRIHLRPAAKSFELSDLAVDVEGKITDTLGVKGSLKADFLSVDILKGDKLHAVVRGVSGSASLSGDYTATVELSGLKGAAVDVGPDGIRIGSDDPAEPGGLFIEQLTARSLDIKAVVGGHKANLLTWLPHGGEPGGRVDLLGIRTKVRIDKRVPAEKGRSPFKTLAFENFTIDRIVLDALQVDLPDDDVSIVIPPSKTKGDETFIRNLELTSPIGTDKTKLHPDFTIDLDTMKIEGTASIAELSAGISAKIKDKFTGDVRISAGKSDLYLYAGGGMKIDVTKPLVEIKRAADLGGGRSIQVGKLGAVRLVYTDADGHLYVEKPYISDLEYIQLVPGTTTRAVWIKVRQVDLKQLDVNIAKGVAVDIPSLDITDAFFSLNLATLTKKAPGDDDAGASTSTFDPTSIRPVMNEIDGSILAEIYVSSDIVGLKDIHIGTDSKPLKVPIVKGEVDIPGLEAEIKGAIYAVQIGSGVYLRPWVVNAVANDPMLAIHSNALELGVYYINPPTGVSKGNDVEEKNRPKTKLWKPILKWDLRAADLARAYSNKFSLWSAVFDLHSDPPKTAEDIAKMSEDERKKYDEETKANEDLLKSLEIRKLDASFDIRNERPIPIPISSDSLKGSIMLSKNSLLNLHVKGGVPAEVTPVERPGRNPGKLDLGFDFVNLDAVNLTIYDLAPPDKKGDPKKLTGLSTLRTGKITLDKLQNGSVSFIDLRHPDRLTGTIRSAHAENISWTKY
ncbi:hypothetical protein [Microbacterium deminutum]|uniref:DUF4157 domain-containing protein n=1 Tax=Microbacterium deminutum TaxID=344164 RepID=A0ABN2QLQ0_9MICO